WTGDVETLQIGAGVLDHLVPATTKASVQPVDLNGAKVINEVERLKGGQLRAAEDKRLLVALDGDVDKEGKHSNSLEVVHALEEVTEVALLVGRKNTVRARP